MSTFELECAVAASGVVCQHIAEFYPHVAGDPAVFCQINDDELPQGFGVEITPSDTNDACHREIIDVSNGALKRGLRNKRHWSNFFICTEAGSRPLAEGDFDLLG